MTTLILATEHTDLFAAEFFVDGQWDITTLQNLETQKFIYCVAGGDNRALAGQNEVKNMLNEDGIGSVLQRTTIHTDKAMANVLAKTEF